jgi:DNA topoisomerase-1
MANRSLTIDRQKNKAGFYYRDLSGQIRDKKKVEWIESLAIPPAWEDVHIAASHRAKILASGRDEAGRLQAIYNPKFRAKRDKLKFDRTLRFAKALPKLRKQLVKDLNRKKLDKQKVVACIVKLIDEAYFRVGNEKYAKINQSYGITTMRSKHTSVKGNTVTFNFIGKSGKSHIQEIKDPKIAQIVKRLDELPGYEIFRYQDKDGDMHDIDSNDVNDYIKQNMGEEFTAKDFRTWGGTLIATSELIAAEVIHSIKERDKFVIEVIKTTAKRLGNTPAVARGSYIDPRVINAYMKTTDIRKMKQAMIKMRPRKYMSRDEVCVMKLLNAG